jgi:hypothetical protein
MRLVIPFLVFLVGCVGDPELFVGTQPLITASETPDVGIDLEEGGVLLSPASVSGWARDPEQPSSTLPVQLISDVQGVLWYGNPDGTGEWTWEGDLEPGPQVLTLVAGDRELNAAAASVSVVARTNEAPRCSILAPANGDTPFARTDVEFVSAVSDADGDAMTVLWRSSLEGPLSNGPSFVRRLTKLGAHDVTIIVTDGFAECRDTISILVR